MKLPPYFLFNMAKKKAGAREKADKFLAAIGTAGGPIGAPGLVQFGAGDTSRQVMSGNVDEYAAIRMQDMQTQVGNPNAPQPRMPRDLDNSYLKLNLPGSPLPANGLLAPRGVSHADMMQDQIGMQMQYALMPNMPVTGQLPVGYPPMPNQKGKK